MKKTSVTRRWRSMELRYQYETREIREVAVQNFIRRCTDEELERALKSVLNGLGQAASDEIQRRQGHDSDVVREALATETADIKELEQPRKLVKGLWGGTQYEDE